MNKEIPMETKEIVDKILQDGVDIEDTVNEIFGPARIKCDKTDCVSNTKGTCQATNIQIKSGKCTTYRVRTAK